MKFLNDLIFNLVAYLRPVTSGEPGLGKRELIQRAAARKPTEVHHHTRQQRRANERAARKGRAA